MDDQAIAYAKAYLLAHHADRDMDPGYAFRSRGAHIARVCHWVERLMVQEQVPQPDALRLAAALHDVGRAHGIENHGAKSAEVLRLYARTHGIVQPVADRAAFLVAEHSNKTKWMPDPDAPPDLVLLMEADLLDEEGAMGLVLDCIMAGALGATDYTDVYDRMLKYEPKRLAHNPMRTPLARQYWQEKQHIIRTFMDAFAFDMGMNTDEA